MSFRELEHPKRAFELMQELGSGSYGRVWQALDKQSGATVAIKMMSLDEDEMTLDVESVQDEVAMMQRLSASEFIVSYFDAFTVPKYCEVWISMEFCEIGSALDLMRILQKPYGEEAVRCILRDCLEGLGYLHAQKVVHRDLKAGNVLLTSGGRARLTDFGVSGMMDNSKKRMTVIGSPYWMAPEVIKEVGYSYQADIWGLGITLIEMLEMLPPRADMMPMKVLLRIPSLPPPELAHPENVSEKLVDFLKYCLVKIPDARWSAVQLKQHPWMAAPTQPARVVDLIQSGLELISRYGSRTEAMKAREESADEDDEEDEEEPQPSEVKSPSRKRRGKKGRAKANANMTIRIVAEDSKVTASEVKKKSKFTPEVAACMKKLTRVLRTVKNLKSRADKGEPSELILKELAGCKKTLDEMKDAGIESDTCQKALKKLRAEMNKVTKKVGAMGTIVKATPPEKKPTPPKLSITPVSSSPSTPTDSPKPKKRVLKLKKVSKSDGDVAEFQRMLADLNLESHTADLAALGVERASDLKFVTDADLVGLKLKPIEKKKLFSIREGQLSPGSPNQTSPSLLSQSDSSRMAASPAALGSPKKRKGKRSVKRLSSAGSNRRQSVDSAISPHTVTAAAGSVSRGSKDLADRATDKDQLLKVKAVLQKKLTHIEKINEQGDRAPPIRTPPSLPPSRGIQSHRHASAGNLRKQSPK